MGHSIYDALPEIKIHEAQRGYFRNHAVPAFVSVEMSRHDETSEEGA